MRVVLSLKAQRDLVEIGDYIALDSRERARTFAIELRDACLALGKFPERYPVAFSKQGVRVRCRNHGRYIIYYRAELETIFVLRVVHSAKDQETIFQ